MVLAAVVMLVLAVAVLTTIHVGQGIHQRVRVQNTADAAAYSMAAAQARAFNFYAYANRTQASHYVSAMALQSLLSFIYFAEAFLVDVYGMMSSMLPCIDPKGAWIPICEGLKVLPLVGSLIQVASTVGPLFRQFLEVVLTMLRQFDPDLYIGRYLIPAHRTLNGVLAAASQATLYATLAQVAGSAADVVQENDPSLDLTATQVTTGLLSACIFNRAHMREANGDALNPVNPFQPLDPKASEDNNKVARAKRAMAQVANATRFACSGGACSPGWVTNRSPEQLLPLPSWLMPVRSVLDHLPKWKWGQTRLLSHGFVPGSQNGRREDNYIRHWADPPSSPLGTLAQGDNLGSDDIYQLPLGSLTCDDKADVSECWGDNKVGKDNSGRRNLPLAYALKTSIWAMNDEEGRSGGLHYRLAYSAPSGAWPAGPGWQAPGGPVPGVPSAHAAIGLSERLVLGIFSVFTANVRGIEDGNHPWKGVAPFSHFEPGHFDSACAESVDGAVPSLVNAATRHEEFNQPSSWVLLRKSPARLQGDAPAPARLNEEGQFRFGQAQLDFDDERPGLLGVPGITVLSRGQTYYHRPGNWAEHPNFFNPYWRPRLGSVWQGRASLPLVDQAARALPEPLKGMPQKVLVH